MKYLMDKGWYTYVGSDTHTYSHFKRIMSLDIDRDIADKVAEILIDNPFGNGSEKTPICIIKNYHRA